MQKLKTKPNLILRVLALALIGITLIATNAFQNKKEIQSNEMSIPKLLDRNEAIQYGNEWTDVQNIYAGQLKKIHADVNVEKAQLTLAQLFIKEARVTGEHGHYYPAALQMLNNILESEDAKNDLRFIALSTKAGVQLSLHEFQDAMKTGQEAVALNPYNAQILGVLVDAHVELGDYEKAIEIADQMMKIRPDIRSYSRVSYLREIHGDIEGSLEAMSMAVKSGLPGKEETAWAALTLGELYLTYEDPDVAKKIFQSILEVRPNYPFALAGIADVYKKKGELEKAEAYYMEAISAIPEVGFYISLAEIYEQQLRHEEKSELIQEILVMLEDDVLNGHNMNLEYADLYLTLLDDPQTAWKYANEEYQKRPANIDVNRMLARITAESQEFNATQKYLAAATRTNSKHPELTDLRSSF